MDDKEKYLLIAAGLVAVGVAIWYFKFRKNDEVQSGGDSNAARVGSSKTSNSGSGTGSKSKSHFPLKKGSCNTSVRALQDYFVKIGKMTNADVVAGKNAFGAKTLSALKEVTGKSIVESEEELNKITGGSSGKGILDSIKEAYGGSEEEKGTTYTANTKGADENYNLQRGAGGNFRYMPRPKGEMETLADEFFNASVAGFARTVDEEALYTLAAKIKRKKFEALKPVFKKRYGLDLQLKLQKWLSTNELAFFNSKLDN